MDNLIKDDKGFIKTGEGTYVNPQYLSQSGLESARNFAIGQTPTISSDTLTPTRQFNIPSIEPSTLSGEIDAGADTIIERANLQREQQQAKIEASNKLAESENLQKQTFEKIVGIPTERAKIETEQKITEKDQSLQDATRNLEELKRAEVNELRSLEGQGLTDKERAIKQREIQSRYSFRKADASLEASFALDDYEAAQRAVDRKVKALTEPLELQYKFYSDVLDNNRDLFTKADANLLETRKEKIKSQSDEIKKNQEEIFKIQLEASKNGAPMSVVSQIGKAKTPEEALSNAGEYTVKQTRGGVGSTTIDGVKLTSPQKTRLDAINTVSAQLQNYRNLVDAYTGFGGSQLTGKQAAQLRTAKSALEFSIANAVGTGALQAADREVVRDLLPDPTSIRGAIGGFIRGGKSGNLTSIDEAGKIFESARNTILSGSATSVNQEQSTGQNVNANDPLGLF